MRRPLLLASAAFVAALLGAWFVLGAEPAHAPARPSGDAQVASVVLAPVATSPAPTDALIPAPATSPEPLPDAATFAVWVNAPPPPAHAFPPSTIVGRVVDADGHPANQAEITLLPDMEAFRALLGMSPVSNDTIRARTRADGRFRLEHVPLGTKHLVTVHHDRLGRGPYAMVSMPAGATIDLGDIALEPALRCEGRVAAPDGTPVAGAELFMSVIAATGPGSTMFNPLAPPTDEDIVRAAQVQSLLGRLVPLGRTTASGHFGVDVPVGATLLARAPGHAPGFSSGEFGSDEECLITLQPLGLPISGRVRSADDSPLPDGMLIAALPRWPDKRDSMPAAQSPDAEGRFTFTGLEDTPHDLKLFAPGHEIVVAERIACGSTDVELMLAPACPAEVRVTAADGTPVPSFDIAWRKRDAFFDFLSPRDPWHHAHAGPDSGGVLMLSAVNPDWYRMQAWVPGGACSKELTIRVTATSPAAQITLRLGAPRTLRGRVVIADEGTPLVDALLELQSDEHQPLPFGAVRSGEDGSFELAPVGNDPVQLTVSRPGFMPWSRLIEKNEGEPILVELQRAAAVHVRIGPVLRAAFASEGKQHHASTSVRLVSPDGSVKHERPLEVRCFLFEAVEPGEWLVELSGAPGPTLLKITAPAGELTVVAY